MCWRFRVWQLRIKVTGYLAGTVVTITMLCTGIVFETDAIDLIGNKLITSVKYTRIGFLNRIFLNKDRIEDSLLMWETFSQRKSVFWQKRLNLRLLTNKNPLVFNFFSQYHPADFYLLTIETLKTSERHH